MIGFNEDRANILDIANDKFAGTVTEPILGKQAKLAQVKLLPPVANPGKVVAAPVNYKAHLEESRNDVEINFNRKVIEIQTIGLFLKATSSIVGGPDTPAPVERTRVGNNSGRHSGNQPKYRPPTIPSTKAIV